jgi:predicted acyl esterase
VIRHYIYFDLAGAVLSKALAVRLLTIDTEQGVSTMSVTSRLVSRLMHLPPAETHALVVTRNLKVPMPDGVMLLADHYAPRNGPTRPTILIRSPYGRTELFGALSALSYAERGYQVLIQSCRGTAGSGGQFAYARHEHDDGLATIAWITRQEWFSGELAMVEVETHIQCLISLTRWFVDISCTPPALPDT